VKPESFLSLLIMATAVIVTLAGLQVGVQAQTSDKGDRPEPGKSPEMEKIDSTKHLPQVVAYYFHGNVRCATCRKIEAYTKEAIDSAFADQLKAGVLEWHVVNVDSVQNRHFVDDYQLYTRSVILADVHQGVQTKWKNLDKVWTLVRDKGKFVEYVQSEVKQYIDSAR
jgi:hypothetical protein